jgi:hypothetical protein
MNNSLIRETVEKGQGIFRLMPLFVPRRFATAGRRLKLHPDDYYALGIARGSIKERWFSSVIPCMNGPLAPPDEGLSYVCADACGQVRFTLRDAVTELGADLIGQDLMRKYGTWPMYSKFFDYETPLFHHVHLDFESAARVGRLGKPECYYFPVQLNNHPGRFPVTYFGFDPDTTREQVRRRLELYLTDDNRITELSRAYRIELGTGWYTPPGVIHAPGSILTYEPQWNSDVNSVFENIASDEIYSFDYLTENCPDDQKMDLDYVMSLLDWEKNVDPHYKKTYFRPPVVCSSDENHVEKWIAYGNEYVSAKEMTLYPGRAMVMKDPAAYGCILIQGHGRFGAFDAETPVMMRCGQPGADEYFVSERAAREGLTLVNTSCFDNLVILKHFADNHPGVPACPHGLS